MKMLSVLVFLASAQAFACPVLTGTYTCAYQDGSKEKMVISQEVRGGVTQYNINGTTVKADKQVYSLPDSAELKEARTSSWCEQGLLIVALAGKYHDAGQYVGDLTMAYGFSVTGNTLKQEVAGTLKNQEGEQNFENVVTCTK